MSVTLGIKASPCTGTNAATQWCVNWGDGTENSNGVFISDGEYAVGTATHVYVPEYGQYTCKSYPVTVSIETACGAEESVRMASLFEVCRKQEEYPPDINIPPSTDPPIQYPPIDTIQRPPESEYIPPQDSPPQTNETNGILITSGGLLAIASIIGLVSVFALTR